MSNQASYSPEQIEQVMRVWEKNHSNKVFNLKWPNENKVLPKAVRVTKVFNDFKHGWCVAFEDHKALAPSYFKPFDAFIKEYICICH